MPTKKQTFERQAEAKYAKILKRVESVVGNRTTYNTDLDRMGRIFLGAKFKGVFASDRIPRLTDRSPYCILNLDNSKQPGSHWIAVCKLPSGNSVVYDSFGRKSARIIPDLTYSGNGRIINTDPDPEQIATETNCGARSLAFILLYDTYGYKVAREI